MCKSKPIAIEQYFVEGTFRCRVTYSNKEGLKVNLYFKNAIFAIRGLSETVPIQTLRSIISSILSCYSVLNVTIGKISSNSLCLILAIE